MLRENTTLQELYLNGNEIEDDGLYALSDAVDQRKRGKLQIYIKGNKCSSEALSHLDAALCRHRRKGRGGRAAMQQSSDEEPGDWRADANAAEAAYEVESDDDEAPLIPLTDNVRKEVISVSEDSEESSQGRDVGDVDMEEERPSSTGVSQIKSKAKSIVAKAERIIEKHNEKGLSKKQNELNLMGRKISAQEFHSIFVALKNSSTQKLDLNASSRGEPHLGDSGLKDMVNTLLKSRSSRLEWMDLTNTGLSNGAVPALLEGLQVTRTIKYVDLRGNTIDEKGWCLIKDWFVSLSCPLECYILSGGEIVSLASINTVPPLGFAGP